MTTDPIPVDAFLAGYPAAIRKAADELRAIVKRAAPDAVERIRVGRRVIGYDTAVCTGAAPGPPSTTIGGATAQYSEDGGTHGPRQ